MPAASKNEFRKSKFGNYLYPSIHINLSILSQDTNSALFLCFENYNFTANQHITWSNYCIVVISKNLSCYKQFNQLWLQLKMRMETFFVFCNIVQYMVALWKVYHKKIILLHLFILKLRAPKLLTVLYWSMIQIQ